MIKAITFDLDGVYFNKGKKEFVQKIVELGVLEDKVVRVFLKSDEMNKLYKTGKMSDVDFWQFAISEWGIKKSPEEVMGMLVDSYGIDDKVAETVRVVRNNGYKTCICSNNFPARIEGLDKRFGFLKDFDAIALSYKVGATKPSRDIFSTLINLAGVKPEEIVFADDNDDNLSGAKELGIVSLFYEDFDRFRLELSNLGVNLKPK